MRNLSKREVAFLFVLMFISISGVKAQQMPRTVSESVEAGVNRSFDIKMRSNELERMKTQADRDIASEREPNGKSFPAIKEDFERIQEVNLNSLQRGALKETPDYKTINKAAGEIKKRAFRLKKSLFPKDLISSVQVPNANSQPAAQVDLSKFELKPLSVALDNAIYRFVSSNLFQNTKVVNLDDSIKAQIELNKIIEICFLIESKSKN